MKQQEIVAEIFKKMISMGYYGGPNSFMCHSLEGALYDKIITKEEYDLAILEIKQTLKRSDTPCVSLGGALSLAAIHLFKNDGDYTHIYENWIEDRPF